MRTTNVTYRPMRLSDYKGARELWEQTPGIGMSAADVKGKIRLFLKRNRRTSTVALDGKRIIGTALCGHAARRGYVYHLAVRRGYQRKGVGTVLLDHCVRTLSKQGIERVHLFVYRANRKALRFYRASGWMERKELIVFTRIIS